MFQGYEGGFISRPELVDVSPAPVVPFAIVGTINSAHLMRTMFEIAVRERSVTRQAFVEAKGNKGRKILSCLGGVAASDLSMGTVREQAGVNGFALFPGFRSLGSGEWRLVPEFAHHVLLQKMGEYKHPTISQIRAIGHFAQAADMDAKDVGWCFWRTDGAALTRRVEHIARANGFMLTTAIAPAGTTLEQLIFPGK